jgi:hypothetical protein
LAWRTVGDVFEVVEQTWLAYSIAIVVVLKTLRQTNPGAVDFVKSRVIVIVSQQVTVAAYPVFVRPRLVTIC